MKRHHLTLIVLLTAIFAVPAAAFAQTSRFDSLRETVHHTNDLIRAMKKERQHQRLLKNTLKSLKDLQAAAA